MQLCSLYWRFFSNNNNGLHANLQSLSDFKRGFSSFFFLTTQQFTFQPQEHIPIANHYIGFPSFSATKITTPRLEMDSSTEAVRLEKDTSKAATDFNKTIITSNKNENFKVLGDSSAVIGINPANDHEKSTKEVRFDNKVKVFEVPEPQTTEPITVKFSEDIVNMDTSNSGIRTTITPPKKHVRFSCLKHPKQPLSHGLSLLQLLRRRTASPISHKPVAAKKQVRFGALKCQKGKCSDAGFGHSNSDWDEAETRRVFKRECMRFRGLQPLSVMDQTEGDDDWDST